MSRRGKKQKPVTEMSEKEFLLYMKEQEYKEVSLALRNPRVLQDSIAADEKIVEIAMRRIQRNKQLLARDREYLCDLHEEILQLRKELEEEPIKEKIEDVKASIAELQQVLRALGVNDENGNV